MSRPEGTHRDGTGGNADLAAVVVAVAVLDLLVALQATPGIVRAAVAIPILLFVPGYAVVAALFPEDDGHADDRRHLGLLGRLVLAVGASVGVVVTVGVALEFTVYGFRAVPALVGINAVTVLALGAAWRRRRATDGRQFGVAAPAAFSRVRSILVGDGRVDAALSVVVVLCVLTAAGAVYAAPGSVDGGSEAYLLTESDGDLVADDYPRELIVDEPTTLHLAVSGPDGASEATVVVALHDVDTTGDGATVTSSTELDRFTVSLDGDTTVTEHEVVPTVAGELRLTYLVYFGSAAADPRPENADRQVHLQVRVSDA
ncbi:DUF1616 domain-containing protein [Natronomonas gomsonensis]|uniref:DUF1616 domain-containing protein n=1 Tax=Natronomonas gomsonensis TaxID=1046043 RepID=UPI0015BBCF27